MRKGKLTPSELQSVIFDIVKRRREEVLLSAGFGEDCAVLKIDENILVTTDPITTKCNNIGNLAINVNANDISASGGEPIAVTITILAPSDSSTEEIKNIMLDAEEAAEQLNIDIVGGHTEFTDAVNRIVVNCTMIGKVSEPVNSSGAKSGDSIIMTKYAAIEGTLILAERIKEISAQYQKELEWMRVNLSVITEGRIASRHKVSAMHDVTEGGVFGAVAEMCGGLKGALIDVKSIPIMPVTKMLTEKYGLNVYKLIGSGSMLMTTDKPIKLIKALNESGIPAIEIGIINNSGKVIADYCDRYVSVEVEVDEILKADENL